MNPPEFKHQPARYEQMKKEAIEEGANAQILKIFDREINILKETIKTKEQK